MKHINPIQKEELEKVFRYDEKTNTLERWFRDVRWKVVNISVAKGGCDYVQVRFINRMILVHRVIFTLVNGNIPDDMTIDHIDNDKSNNNIKNLQLLSTRDNTAKSGCGLKPYFHTLAKNYQVVARVMFGEKQHQFYFGSFKILTEAQALCDAYRAQFGYDMPLFKVRDSTPEYWLECMQTFKDMYFNTQGESSSKFSVTFKRVNLD